MARQSLRLETSVDERTGHMRAAYIRIREGKVARTKEIEDGVAFADYDEGGLLLGIELLGPCRLEVLDRLAAEETGAAQKFLKGAPPRELVLV